MPAGVTLGENHLAVSGRLDSAQLDQVFLYLCQAEAGLFWRVGDFLAYVCRHEGEGLAEKYASLMPSPRRARDALALARAFPVADRITDGATPTHHERALQETQDPGKALEWVRRAAAAKLSAREMVEAIRLKKRIQDQDGDGVEDGPRFDPSVKPIMQLVLRCQSIDPEKYGSKARADLRQALEPVIKLYRRLAE